jgi:hypothetical protein
MSQWRHTARPIKVGPVSAMVLAPLFLIVFNHTMWALKIALAAIFFLGVAEYFKLSISTITMKIRSKLAGRHVRVFLFLGEKLIRSK